MDNEEYLDKLQRKLRDSIETQLGAALAWIDTLPENGPIERNRKISAHIDLLTTVLSVTEMINGFQERLVASLEKRKPLYTEDSEDKFYAEAKLGKVGSQVFAAR